MAVKFQDYYETLGLPRAAAAVDINPIFPALRSSMIPPIGHHPKSKLLALHSAIDFANMSACSCFAVAEFPV
jgi:hypothetical protein